MNSGWIKLFRKLIDWEWYSEPNTLRLYIHLLLTANFEEQKWQGRIIQPGQLLTGREKLASELNLSPQEIRTALNKLKSTNEITIQSTNRFSIITICKWTDYQECQTNNQPAKQTTNHLPSNLQSTTIKEEKERKEEKNISTPKFDLFWDTYDKKVGREKCLEAWKNIPESEIEKILEHVPKYVASTPIWKYRKNPLTYLTDKHWLNDDLSRDTSIIPSNKTLDGRPKLAV